MCRWRTVTNLYTLCGHQVVIVDEELKCDDRYCKFSTTHPPECGPNCSTTCWQYRQFPEIYKPQLPRYCPDCEARLGSGGRTS